MSFEPGMRLGPYEIVARLGQGGMGEVYRAHDPRLGRDVAIKTSIARFSERFEREARAVAALNHPNICTLFDVGPNYLVMELIEGPTLADRIQEGPVPLEEALAIARQIGEALEAAHEKGIVHRDLKPANVKIQADGRVKVLDFGLAKMSPVEAGPSGEDSPTISMGTQAGVILGTASYMAPEQARGKVVDKRADIWAFGVVLYEMLTAEKVFGGETVSDMLAAVLTRELDMNKAPFEVRRVLKSCLERDPRKRLRDIGDAWKLLDEAPVPVTAAAPVLRKSRWIWPAATAVATITAAGVAFLHLSESEPARQPVRFRVGLPANVSFINTGMLSMSPDGRYVAFPALTRDGKRALWLHSLDALEPQRLEVEVQEGASIFWSPDSSVLVVQDRQRRLRRIAIPGGEVQTIAELPMFVAGGSWSPEGTLLLGSEKGIVRMPAGGGTPTALTHLAEGENFHAYPVFLPDWKRFVYLKASGTKGKLAIASIDKQPSAQSGKTVLDYPAAPVFAPEGDGGKLLFLRDEALVAQDLDIDGEQLTGTPRVVSERVEVSQQSFPMVAASANGRLVYRAGSAVPRLQLTWYDRKGQSTGTVGEPAPFTIVALSPDAARIATRVFEGQGKGDIWLMNVADGGLTRFTFGPENDNLPVWSPDGKRLAYVSDRTKQGIYVKASSGAGGEEHVFDFPRPGNFTDWSQDGRYLLYQSVPEDPKTQLDEWIVPLAEPRTPVAVVRTPGSDVAGRISPDGRYIAYRSNFSGTNEVYVEELKLDGSAGGQWMISKGGAIGMIRWRGDGRELLYLANSGTVMSVEVSTAPVFRASTPRELFQIPLAFARGASSPGTLADVTRDGQRFLFAMPTTVQEEFHVVLDWTAPQKQ